MSYQDLEKEVEAFRRRKESPSSAPQSPQVENKPDFEIWEFLEPREVECESCHLPHLVTPKRIKLKGGEYSFRKVCQECVDREADEKARAESLHRQEMEWQAVCPPLYRDTDPKRIPRKILDKVNSWEHGPKGLGLLGSAGLCKTRAAFLLIRRMIEEGRSVATISATGFSRLCIEQFDDDLKTKNIAKDKMRWLRRREVILFDDIGKQKFTERVEIELYDLLEYRTSNLLPVIWTANASSKQLLTMLSDDRGEPILRRLSEFSEIVTM